MRAVKRYFWSCLSILLIPAALFAAEAQNAFNEGVKLYKAAKYKEAVAAFNRAIKAAPKSDEAYNNRGLAYAKLGQQDNALKDYDEALKLNPNLTDAQFNRGNVFFAQKQYDRAVKDFDEVIKQDPKAPRVLRPARPGLFESETVRQGGAGFQPGAEARPQGCRNLLWPRPGPSPSRQE